MKNTMKKRIAIITATVASIAIVGGAIAVAAAPKNNDTKEATGTEATYTAGGWMINSEAKANIPAEAQAAFDKAMENYTGMSLKPIALLGSQVVAGTNYKFLCEGTTVYPGAQPELKVVTVYQDLEGKAEVSNVADFNLADMTQEEAQAAEQAAEGQTCGGWTVNEESKSALPADVQKAFDTATADLVGVNYTPVAVLGTQVVAGQNTAILCVATPVTPDATPHLAVVTIYTPIEGAATITNITNLNIAAL